MPPAHVHERSEDRVVPTIKAAGEQGADPAQFYLPEGVYRLYDNVVKDCEVCQKTKPAPLRAQYAGVRAKNFGDVVFVDHCEVKHITKKHELFLVLDGATRLLWGSTQDEGTEPATQFIP